MVADEIFGYIFKDASLLEEALTTPSYRMSYPSAKDNQRLEFLGDAVIGLLCADRLYAEHPNEQEGRLTVRRSHMVSSAALCEAAARHSLADRLRRNKGADALPANSKTLADAVEAVLGAAWLDGGMEAAKTVFAALELQSRADASEWFDNPKGELQVRSQAMEPPRRPEYTLVKMTGRSDSPVFTIKVAIEGVGEAVAEARSRKEAEALAAQKLLSKMI